MKGKDQFSLNDPVMFLPVIFVSEGSHNMYSLLNCLTVLRA